MIYKFVQRPQFVGYGPQGEIEELFCKVCGSAIGGMTERIKGRRLSNQGQWIEERILQFRRFHNYAEMKMEFEDGSAHVTNGCSSCLHENLTQEQLHELHIADMELDNGPHTEVCCQRVPKGVAAIRTDGGGIA